MNDEEEERDGWGMTKAERDARARHGQHHDNDLETELHERYRHGELLQETYEAAIKEMYGPMMRRFVLDRNVDLTGVSGTGVVAEGVEFSDGVVCLHWTSAWPSSVVHYDRGLDSVLAVHGHDGRTVLRFLDGPTAGEPKGHSH